MISLVHALSAPVSAADGCQYSTEAKMGKMIFESYVMLFGTEKTYTLNLWKYVQTHDLTPTDPVAVYASEYFSCHQEAYDDIFSTDDSQLKDISMPDTLYKSRMISYAENYAIHPSPDYKEFSVDCTNFASQIVHEGGQRMDFSWLRGWYMEKVMGYFIGWRWRWSYTWSVTDGFQSWMTRNNVLYMPINGKKMSYHDVIRILETLNGKVGFIQIDYEGSSASGPDHTFFVYKKDGQWFMAQHTYNYNGPFREDVINKPSVRRIWIMGVNFLKP